MPKRRDNVLSILRSGVPIPNLPKRNIKPLDQPRGQIKSLQSKYLKLIDETIDPIIKLVRQELYPRLPFYKDQVNQGITADSYLTEKYRAVVVDASSYSDEQFFDALLSEIKFRKDAGLRWIVTDGVGDDISRQINLLRVQHSRLQPQQLVMSFVENHAKRVAATNKGFQERQFSRLLGFDPFVNEPYLSEQIDGFVSNNVALIESLGEETFDDIEAIVKETVLQGRSLGEIRSFIERKFDTSENRAAFIARDQTSKLNANLTRFRQQAVGVDEYTWVDSGDSRVRRRHSVLNGRVFKWTEPPVVDFKTGRTAHPGEDFNCRCTARPVINKLLDAA